MENGDWRMESGEWRVESGEWRVEKNKYTQLKILLEKDIFEICFTPKSPEGDF